MKHQEKFIYLSLLLIMKMLIEMTPPDEFDDTFSDRTKEDIVHTMQLLSQYLDEIKENENQI